MDKRDVKEINTALDVLYELLGADRSMHFEPTAGSAEGVSQVLYNVHFSHPEKKVRIALSPSAEAPAQLTTGRIGERLEIPLNENGQVTVDAVRAALESGVDLVSLSWADGLTGVVHPILEIAQLCFDQGTLLHVDGTHALGRLFFRLSDVPIDYFTFDGGLLIKEGAPFKPLILGKEPPTAMAMQGLANTLQERFSQFDLLNIETARLRDHFEERLSCGKPLFQSVQRLPHLSTIAFPGVAAETLYYLLQERGVALSLGGGTLPKLSHILKQSRIDPLFTHSALSFTFTTETTREAIEGVLDLLSETCVSLAHRAAAFLGDPT